MVFIIVTCIVNYSPLQLPERVDELKDLLKRGSFTHALVMEPHMPCYFTLCNATGTCDGCESIDKDDVYGCGWSKKLWKTFEAAFDSSHLAHVVPWSVPTDASVEHPPSHSRTLRTRAIVEKHACSAQQATSSSDLSTVQPGVTSRAHQCLVVCGNTTFPPHWCRWGTPVLVAYFAMQLLEST